MTLPVLVISLPGSPRRALIEARLAKLGIDFQFIDAIDGRAMSESLRRELYDAARAIRRLGRFLTPGEIGCALSHRLAYQAMIETNNPAAIILEDDAIPSLAFKAFYEQAAQIPKSIDLLSLYAGHGIVHRRPAALFNGFELFRNAANVDGCCAYFIRLAMAKRLFAATGKISTVADWPLPARQLKHYVMQPALIAHDFSAPSEVGEDRPHFNPPPPPVIRKLAGLWAFTLLPYLLRPEYYDGLYNYYERELRTRIKARMSWRYHVLNGRPQWCGHELATPLQPAE